MFLFKVIQQDCDSSVPRERTRTIRATAATTESVNSGSPSAARRLGQRGYREGSGVAWRILSPQMLGDEFYLSPKGQDMLRCPLRVGALCKVGSIVLMVRS